MTVLFKPNGYGEEVLSLRGPYAGATAEAAVRSAPIDPVFPVTIEGNKVKADLSPGIKRGEHICEIVGTIEFDS